MPKRFFSLVLVEKIANSEIKLLLCFNSLSLPLQSFGSILPLLAHSIVPHIHTSVDIATLLVSPRLSFSFRHIYLFATPFRATLPYRGEKRKRVSENVGTQQDVDFQVSISDNSLLLCTMYGSDNFKL